MLVVVGVVVLLHAGSITPGVRRSSGGAPRACRHPYERRDRAFAAGAIVGGALAPRPYYYEPAPVYVAPPPPAYVEPAPAYEPACYWTRGEPVWNGYAWVRPRVQVCD